MTVSNELVDERTRERVSNAVSEAIRPARLSYILAASHSGSTLLAMLLGAHPEVCTVGELRGGHADRPGYRCSCGELVNECKFWRRVSQIMSERGLEYDVRHPGTDISKVGSPFAERLLRPLHRGRFLERLRDTALAISPTWRAAQSRIQHRNAELVRAICRVAGRRIVVDSSKGAIRAKYLLRNDELDVKIIRLLRDGRAVMLTYMNPFEFANTRNPKYRGVPSQGLSPEQAALQWKRANESADALMATLPLGRGLVVRYEAYCKDPELELQRIFAFLGADPDRVNLDFRTVEQHVVGNQMRFDESPKVDLDERWKRELSPDSLRRFDRIAGDLNRVHGYF